MDVPRNDHGRILIVDDEAGMRQVLDLLFREKGFEVTAAANGADAIVLLGSRVFDVVVTDLKMPGKDGMAVLKAVKAAAPECPVLMITAYGTIETAVEAMRLGACDFITKPFKLAEMELKVSRALAGPRRNGGAVEPGSRRLIAGESAHSQQLLAMITKIANSRSSVLITGESGTGKELIARAIHEASPRRSNPFIALNCAALSPGILESELFGHEKGAFTGAVARRQGRFERAHTGTLFLDEVGEIDPNVQTKLLRVLQEGEFERVGGAETVHADVRIVAATNRDLREAILEGRFREDFFYRMNVFSLRAEPLRNRREDIPPLVAHFLERLSVETGKHVRSIAPEVMEVFMRHSWPGNIRELENILERAVVLSESDIITLDELPPDLADPIERIRPIHMECAPTGASLSEKTEIIENEMIRAALDQFHWNKTKAAAHLGIKRTTLQYKIRKLGLE